MTPCTHTSCCMYADCTDRPVRTVRVDAHQHFWHYTPEAYPWISDTMSVLRRDFTPEDLAPLLKASGIDGTIAVQARASRDETRALLALADATPWLFGVVGWLDPRSPSLEADMEHDAHPLLKGYRHQVQDEPSPAACLADPAFNRGVEAILKRGLVYEVLIHGKDLEAATTFCAQHDGELILDHLGKPDVQHEPLTVWRDRIRPLADLPHVTCKLSGLITEAVWNDWTPEQLRPWLHTALDCFGPHRVLFGSDWPVCLLAGDYPKVHALLNSVTASLSTDEQAAIWGCNAFRIYSL